MSKYEALFLIKPDLKKEDQEGLLKSIHEEITKRGGKIKDNQNLSKRTLAYEINKYKSGIYILVDFEAPTEIIDPLVKIYKLNNNILRSLILNKDKKSG